MASNATSKETMAVVIGDSDDKELMASSPFTQRQSSRNRHRSEFHVVYIVPLALHSWPLNCFSFDESGIWIEKHIKLPTATTDPSEKNFSQSFQDSDLTKSQLAAFRKLVYQDSSVFVYTKRPSCADDVFGKTDRRQTSSSQSEHRHVGWHIFSHVLSNAASSTVFPPRAPSICNHHRNPDLAYPRLPLHPS